MGIQAEMVKFGVPMLVKGLIVVTYSLVSRYLSSFSVVSCHRMSHATYSSSSSNDIIPERRGWLCLFLVA